MKDISSVDVKELARIIEPEAWMRAEAAEAAGQIPDFEDNILVVRSMTIAQKVLNYLWR